MLKESRTDEKYENKVSKVIREIEKMGFENIKADLDDYEAPHQLVGKSRDINFAPDVTAEKRGGKSYFEIAKKVKNTKELINKWKLLAALAEMKNGVFKIYVPHGHMRFTQELVNRHNIGAELIKL